MGCPGCFPAGVVMRHLLLPALAASLFVAPSVPAQEDARAIITRGIRAECRDDCYQRARATREKSKGVLYQGDIDINYRHDALVQLPGQMRSEMELDLPGEKLKMLGALNG